MKSIDYNSDAYFFNSVWVPAMEQDDSDILNYGE